MYPDAERFGLYTTEIFILHYWGEILCIGCMAVFMNPNQANSLSALLQAASVLISSGLLKYVYNLYTLQRYCIYFYSDTMFIIVTAATE